MMKYSSSLRSPKKEEEQVPESKSSDFIRDEYELENLCKDQNGIYESLSWDILEFDETAPYYGFREEEEDDRRSFMFINGVVDNMVIKSETTSSSSTMNLNLNLNLNLNYEEVLDAWCDRSPLLLNDFSPSINGYYMGEVPIMEEERSRRRAASVLRYKEKRQTRLFSKKIRYHVRKLNADQRPRIKGRFVKRDS